MSVMIYQCVVGLVFAGVMIDSVPLPGRPVNAACFSDAGEYTEKGRFFLAVSQLCAYFSG